MLPITGTAQQLAAPRRPWRRPQTLTCLRHAARSASLLGTTIRGQLQTGPGDRKH